MTVEKIEITMTEQGAGAPILMLHGGGGPFTVAGLATHLASTGIVLTPTHPGWNGTARPSSISSVADLAELYLRELERRNLSNVTVIGSSMGGWIAAEMALKDERRRIGQVVLINSVGVKVPGQPVVDFFSLTPRQIAEHSYHDPDRFFVDPLSLPPERVAVIKGNITTLKAVAGTNMADSQLLGRLSGIMIPALVIWGESDRIATPAYGRTMSEAFGNGQFALIQKAGHLPQIEQPEATFGVIDAFVAANQEAGHRVPLFESSAIALGGSSSLLSGSGTVRGASFDRVRGRGIGSRLRNQEPLSPICGKLAVVRTMNVRSSPCHWEKRPVSSPPPFLTIEVPDRTDVC